MRDFLKEHKLALVICAILFILPFFWLKPGEMDLGGDNNRLYFYDPMSYLKYATLYSVFTEGMGLVQQRYYEIPYVVLLAFLKIFLSSPTFLIATINGIKLGGAFFAIYLTVCQFIKQIYSRDDKKIYLAGILSGIFYVSALGSIHISSEWETALTTHNLVFLNPLIFYLLFRFFLTQRYAYLSIALIISFIFASNFSFTGSATFFAFYPIAIGFLLMYVKFFAKKPILKGIVFGLILFLGTHTFHLLSQFTNLFDHQSAPHAQLFNPAVQQEGLRVFGAVSSYGMTILNLLLSSQDKFLRMLSFAPAVALIIGLMLNKKKEVLFSYLFFFITFFLVTANITNIGYHLYKSLFHISVFSMFRFFYVKWMYVFLFFYALLFGLSMYTIFLKLKPFYTKLFMLLGFAIFIIVGIPLFSGSLVNRNIGGSNLKMAITMDPAFEQTIKFINTLSDDGKFLSFPLTDFNFQLVSGKYGGAYAGTPILAYLRSKYGFYGTRDFGWQDSDLVKYAELITKYASEKNYDHLLRIFATLNIRYIFHNSDPKIYEESFKIVAGPYAYIKSSLPATQKDYSDFIQHFPVHEIYKKGPYFIYELDKSVYNPTIFIPDGIYQSDKLSFDEDKIHAVFIDPSICDKEQLKDLCHYKPSDAKNIHFTMVNPTLYKVDISQSELAEATLLVMQHTFNKGWKLIIDDKSLPEDRHISVNGYANGWLLKSTDFPNDKTNVFYIELESQKYFWYGWAVTAVSLTIVIALLVVSLVKQPH